MTTASPSKELTPSATTAPTIPPSPENAPPQAPTTTQHSPQHSPSASSSGIKLLHLNSQLTLSEKRLAANRANALKSTGPKTSQGKTKSSQNALKHGLRAQVYFDNPPAKTHLCPEESNHPAECGATYATFEYELRQELQPKTILQKTLFPQIVTLSWRLRRLPHTEQEIFARLAPHHPHSQIAIATPQSAISNPQSAIPTDTPHSQIANRNSQIPSTNNPQPPTDTPQNSALSTQHSALTLPPPCQSLADAFCSGPSNPFTLFNRYERSLQNALLRLLRQYEYLKKHHPFPPTGPEDMVPREPAETNKPTASR